MDFRGKFAVKPGGKIKLSKIDPNFKGEFKKSAALERIVKNTKELARLQYNLYAESKQSLLIVLQAMDAGGKDGTVNHVMAPLNPQGCRVVGFKQPTPLERDHDFLWRIHRQAPKNGEVVIFNRSHYEDVLITRVHDLVPKKIWSQRYQLINEFENLLESNNTTIVKFYLHIDQEQQLERFKKRLDLPEKHWKISEGDYAERKYWDDYQAAFEDALSKCSTKNAPWYVIPANHKWFRNLAVSEILLDTMRGMNPRQPEPSVDIESIRKAYHQAIEAEKEE